MKRIICMLLCVFLLSILPACHYSEGGDILEPVEFVYPRKSDYYLYSDQSSVFGSEIREASGHRSDLKYLISMYLRGPQDAHLRNIFPADTRLIEVRTDGDIVNLVFSSEFLALENTDLTLACAALAQTCMGATDATQVRIDASSDTKTFSITLDADSMLLTDTSIGEHTANEMPE